MKAQDWLDQVHTSIGSTFVQNIEKFYGIKALNNSVGFFDTVGLRGVPEMGHSKMEVRFDSSSAWRGDGNLYEN